MRTSANTSRKLQGVLATMYFNTEQIKEITKDAGDLGYLLMTFYTGIAKQPNPNMEDSQLAKMLERPVKTIERARLKLTKAGWFDRVKVKHKGETHIVYHVGKEAVGNQGSNQAVLSTKVP